MYAAIPVHCVPIIADGYTPQVMFPYSYSCSDFPKDAEILMEAGLGVAKAIKSIHGTTYQAGQACDLV